MDLALRLGRLDVDQMLSEMTLGQWGEWIEYLYPDQSQSPEHMLAIMQRVSYGHNRKN